MTAVPAEDRLLLPGEVTALTSATVTAEAAIRFDGRNRDAIAAMGAEVCESWIRYLDGGWGHFRAGDWVIRYGPGDFGVMSGGAFTRYFPDAAP